MAVVVREILLDKPTATAGLVEYRFTIPSDGPYHINMNATFNLPSNSLLHITQNGIDIINADPIFVTGSLQYAGESKFLMNCLAGDLIVIAIKTRNANVQDNQLNTIKTITTIGSGY